ncbi:MAG TPA: ATP synthase F0 subunit C [Clostridiales bacterium]|nr:ATP synthase F0 subunit C [Clostridiales bacterium]
MILAVQNLVCALTENSVFAIAAAIAVFVGLGAGVGMAICTAKALESIARQPEAESKIRTTLLLGLAFIETTAIYGLFIAIMLVTKVL